MTNESDQSRAEDVLGFKPSTKEASGAPRGDSPLVEFWGTGCGYYVTRGRTRTNREWIRIGFRFLDIEVIEATEVYPHPTADLSMFYSDPATTPRRKAGEGTDDWGAWSESTRAIYGDRDDVLDDLMGGQVPAQGEGRMPENPGRRQHWKRIPTLMRVGPKSEDWRDGEPEEWKTKWHDETVMAWRVLEVEGVGSYTIEGQSVQSGANGAATGQMDLLQHVVDLADGKTDAAFHEVALDDPKVMQNPGLVDQLNQRQFVANMISMQRLSRDDSGVLHKI